MNDHRIEQLVADWDEVFKKGQLTFWVLLAIAKRPQYASEIALFITQATNGHLTVTEQSLYRALRRFRSMGLVEVTKHPSPHGGPERKYYSLTQGGTQTLQRFAARNIQPFFAPAVQQYINRISKRRTTL